MYHSIPLLAKMKINLLMSFLIHLSLAHDMYLEVILHLVFRQHLVPSPNLNLSCCNLNLRLGALKPQPRRQRRLAQVHLALCPQHNVPVLLVDMLMELILHLGIFHQHLVPNPNLNLFRITLSCSLTNLSLGVL